MSLQYALYCRPIGYPSQCRWYHSCTIPAHIEFYGLKTPKKSRLRRTLARYRATRPSMPQILWYHLIPLSAIYHQLARAPKNPCSQPAIKSLKAKKKW